MRHKCVLVVGVLSIVLARLAASDDAEDRLYLKIGGMRPGSGIAGGVEFRDEHFANGWGDLRLESKLSIRLYQQHEIEIIKPHVVDPRVFVEVLGLYRRYTQVDYFGIGADAPEADHTNYRLDGLALFGTIGFRPARDFQLGARAGYLQVNVGSGTDDNLPSIEERFDPDTAPGLDEQPDYYLVGGFFAFDRRNDPEDPTSGVYYVLQSTRYRDLESGRFDFYDVDLDLRHYFPVAKRTSVAVRLRSVLTGADDGREVPFYMLPALGGSDSLHAFENDRFRDRHLLFLNNELRYQVTYAVRIEMFVDAGQVAPRLGQFALGEFEWSFGAGARYKLAGSVLLGTNVGFGREGPRLTFKGDFRF